MTAFLVGTIQGTISYDRKSGRYRDDATGKYVGRDRILRLVDEEANRLGVRMKAHARLMTQGKIDLPEFQRRAADDLKLSHLRSTILGSGGRSQTTSAQFGAAGRELRRQYKFLNGFAQDLAAGKLTRAQAINRAGLYGASTRTAFHQAEKITRAREGFKLARRVLDPASRHCEKCLSYATGDRFLPIEQIVPVGTRCTCQSRCRCSVIFKK